MSLANLGQSSGTDAQNQSRPRVMIYGVGYYASEAVRILVERGWRIVGAVNRAGPKIGQDLGRLAELKHGLGIIVQDCETADYASFGADIALVVQTERLSLNWSAYQRLLGAGINVICHGSESYFPQGADVELAYRIDALAKQGNAGYRYLGFLAYLARHPGRGTLYRTQLDESLQLDERGTSQRTYDASIRRRHDTSRLCGKSHRGTRSTW